LSAWETFGAAASALPVALAGDAERSHVRERAAARIGTFFIV
jgi:hypothetical protein